MSVAIAAPVDVLMGQKPSTDFARANIKKAAQDYEASFLSVMLAQMFKGVETEAPFGGGQGEEMFKSVLTDAISKEITKAGGVGLASTIQREMLKLQGLKE